MLGKALARTEDLVVQESGNELLIYDLKINKAICLNETSALIWQFCDGKHTVSEITDEISKRSKTIVCEDFVWLALDQFNRDGLLENGEIVGDHFADVSRREIIRKIGFTSLVALPIVSSIVAPKAAMAQSGLLANCAPCAAPGQCASGICGPTPFLNCGVGTVFNSPVGQVWTGGNSDQPTCDALALQVCCNGTGLFLGGNQCQCT